jgi:hypothetical protein
LSNRKFFRKIDILVIIILLLTALVFWGVFRLFAGEPYKVRADIIYQGEVNMSVYLDEEPRVFSILELPYVVFSLNEEGIAFIESNCPDQVCVNTGIIHRDGQFAACMPNEVVLKIHSYEE